MKKFLLSIAAAALAFSANANLYVMGEGDGLGWDLPGMVVEPQSEGVYQFSITNLSKFKVSTVEASDWDTFNTGAYATGDTTFAKAEVGKAGGQTLPIVPWGEDQMVPYIGNYTITVDLNNMTMTAYTSTPAPKDAPAVYIRGGMNDWSSPAEWQFTYVAAEDMYYFVCQDATTIQSGTEFKIADASWGNINFSTNGQIDPTAEGAKYTLIFNQQNSYVSAPFTGIIYFKYNGANTSYAIFKSGSFSYDSTVGVKGIESETGVAVYYNLNGQRVNNPEKGIFIKVVDGQVSKVVK